jgi:hypothetical protein
VRDSCRIVHAAVFVCGSFGPRIDCVDISRLGTNCNGTLCVVIPVLDINVDLEEDCGNINHSKVYQSQQTGPHSVNIVISYPQQTARI